MGPRVAVDGHINVALARRPTESGGVGKGAHGRGVATRKAHAESRSLSDRGDGPSGVRHRCCTSIPALVRRSCQDRGALIVVWPSFIRSGGAGVRNKVSAAPRTRQTIYRNILGTAEDRHSGQDLEHVVGVLLELRGTDPVDPQQRLPVGRTHLGERLEGGVGEDDVRRD